MSTLTTFWFSDTLLGPVIVMGSGTNPFGGPHGERLTDSPSITTIPGNRRPHGQHDHVDVRRDREERRRQDLRRVREDLAHRVAKKGGGVWGEDNEISRQPHALPCFRVGRPFFYLLARQADSKSVFMDRENSSLSITTVVTAPSKETNTIVLPNIAIFP